uniref:Uncharacterized protein n=1 Tax=Rhabditophanes sp. KR3021 TaxID=114890 RepID=A0AC35TNS2_9BILA
MLGMMNCNGATDSVEFYCAPSKKSVANSDEDVKLFSEYKDKAQIEYRKDGRRMTADGESSEKIDPTKLWSDLLMKKVIDRKFNISKAEENNSKKAENIPKKNEKRKSLIRSTSTKKSPK